MKRSYNIWDNGGTPFLVDVDTSNKTVQIWKQYVTSEDSDSQSTTDYKQLTKLTYEDIYIGKDPKNFTKEMGEEWTREFVGNSILLKTSSTKYVFIGWDIYSFELEDGDRVVKYYSPMGHSGVPYPVLIGKKNSYFMIEKQYALNDLFDLDQELYYQFYKLKKNDRHDMNHIKMIEERLD